MAPTLEHVMTFHFTLSKEHQLAIGPARGNTSRYVSPIIGGYLQGKDFKADVVPGGSECPTMNPSTGTAYIDGRGQYRDSSTGDTFYVEAKGMVVLDEASQLAFAWSPEAHSTKAGEHTWFTTITFEVSGEKHK